MKRRLSLLVLPALLFATALAPAPAQAVEEHLYDPVLSLRGTAATFSEDLVPDPGSAHPPKPIELPCGAATDSHGDVYVASAVESTAGRIDVFSPQGEYLTEIPDEHQPCGLAVDSEGNVYADELKEKAIVLYEPDSYPPTPTTAYTPATEFHSECGFEPYLRHIAVDPSDDHLYIAGGCRVEEYGSAAEGSPLIEAEVPVQQAEFEVTGIDVYGGNQDIYAVEDPTGNNKSPDRVVVFDGGDRHVKCQIEGVQTEAGFKAFEFVLGASLAVDQSNGDAYVYDTKHGAVYQFSGPAEGCELIGSLPKPPTLRAFEPLGDVAVDAPIVKGEAGYDSPNEGYVFVTSGKSSSNYDLFAFKPKLNGPPEIRAQAALEIAEGEALLRAELNPDAFDTTYRFQYTTQAAFDKRGYEGAESVPVPDAGAGAGGAFGAVSEPIVGLTPGTAYRFRLVAVNHCQELEPAAECVTAGEGKPGEEGNDASFSTYPAAAAGLPDGRAYELVTPPDSGGHVPTMGGLLGNGLSVSAFDTRMSSPDGGSLVFGSNSGALPGIGGGGIADTFEARRGEDGWQSRFIGLTGAQASSPDVGGISADHGYSFLKAEEKAGTLADPETERAQYLRVPPGVTPSPNCAVEAEPEGRFEWIGCGGLGVEPQAHGTWISPGGGHVIFATVPGTNHEAVLRLQECAPPSGVGAIYDRTPGGPTRCVSLPPSGASPQTENAFETKSAAYQGASADGSAVAFTVDALYVRRGNTETLEVSNGNPTFGGLSRDGSRVFYLEDGDVFACDLDLGPCAGEEAHEAVRIGAGGESTLVNVAASGSAAYFVSPVVLSGAEEDGYGAKAEPGAENLYAWDGEGVRFVAPLDPADVSGAGFGSLGGWTRGVSGFEFGTNSGPANDPSRTTPDGDVLVFESSASLTGYDSDGHREVYRYDAGAEPGAALSCLSCNPSGTPAVSDALLESEGPPSIVQALPPVNALTHIDNVSEDGREVFFQSAERLVAADLDGHQDVYEWEAQGKGACKRSGGCLSLISSGRSAEDDYLYAMTPDGHDVFFLSADTLVPQDPDGTPSIYDARVGGGFPQPPAPSGECLGEACQPPVVVPDDPTPASSSFEGSGNVDEGGSPPKHCKKPKVRRHGKCVKKHHKAKHKRHHRRANHNRRATR